MKPLPAFTKRIDYDAWSFLSSYRNYFKKLLVAYSICTLLPIITNLSSKQILTVLHNHFCTVKTHDEVKLWSVVRRRDCTGVRLLISFISAVLRRVNRCLLIVLWSYSTLCCQCRGRVMQADTSRSTSPTAEPLRRPRRHLGSSARIVQVWMTEELQERRSSDKWHKKKMCNLFDYTSLSLELKQ